MRTSGNISSQHRAALKAAWKNGKRLTPEQRFWNKVDKRGPADCWMWISPSERKGYGVMWWDGKVCYAHRIAWVIAGRKLDDDKVIDHLCRNPKCVNPGHLRLVTTRENVHAGISIWAVNSRKTECSNRHAYSYDNIACLFARNVKTRHGHPVGTPRRERICLTCTPGRWRYALIERPVPANARRGAKWLGPEWIPDGFVPPKSKV